MIPRAGASSETKPKYCEHSTYKDDLDDIAKGHRHVGCIWNWLKGVKVEEL